MYVCKVHSKLCFDQKGMQVVKCKFILTLITTLMHYTIITHRYKLQNMQLTSPYLLI